MAKERKVIIIGAGASGLVAAIAAKRAGAYVILLDKNSRVGKKILATGNGRCNITNRYMDISKYHGKHPRFVYGAFSAFGQEYTLEFFEKLGIYFREEEGGRMFPASFQASSVLDVLRYEIENLGVETVCDAEAVDIRHEGQFEIELRDGRKLKSDRVIICTGGKAGPEFGSDGSGFLLSKKFGHSIIEPFPALVQLKLNAKFLKAIQGVKFDGNVELVVDKKVIKREDGEILFTDYGISGPPVFQLSRKAGELIRDGKRVFIKVVLVDYISEDGLRSVLLKRYEEGNKKPVSLSFVGLINKRLIPVVLREAGISDMNKPVASLTTHEKDNILHILKDWRFEVSGTNPWASAQVTAGGVNTEEINPKTMESKIVPGLYFAGEVIDIDGDCGGYNLQWAWSSGLAAGYNSAL